MSEQKTTADLLELIMTNVPAFNAYREEHPAQRIDFTGANLFMVNLVGANLADVNLVGANLASANLTRADFTGADLTDASLTHAILTGADLTDANLTDASLTGADLGDANLNRAILTRADLSEARLDDVREIAYAILVGVNWTGARLVTRELDLVIRASQLLTRATIQRA